jgi:hypothetical protein
MKLVSDVASNNTFEPFTELEPCVKMWNMRTILEKKYENTKAELLNSTFEEITHCAQHGRTFMHMHESLYTRDCDVLYYLKSKGFVIDNSKIVWKHPNTIHRV